EGTEADGVGAFGEGSPGRSPFEEIPGYVLRDVKSGLARGVDVHFDCARRMNRIELDCRCGQTQKLEALCRGAAKIVIADTAGDDARVAKKIRHVGEIGRSSAELLALRQHVPEEFAQADDSKRFCGSHALISSLFPDRAQLPDG